MWRHFSASRPVAVTCTRRLEGCPVVSRRNVSRNSKRSPNSILAIGSRFSTPGPRGRPSRHLAPEFGVQTRVADFILDKCEDPLRPFGGRGSFAGDRFGYPEELGMLPFLLPRRGQSRSQLRPGSEVSDLNPAFLKMPAG